MDRIAAAADLIAAARHGEGRLDGLPENLRPRDQAEGYRVQAEVHRRLKSARVGYKIGCTTAVMQKFLKIDSPCAGGLFASTIFRERAELPFAGFRHVGIECEIAVRLARDVSAGPFTAAALSDAVAAVMPAIEIVDDRYVDYRVVDTPTLIADDFFAWGCVLGPEAIIDLARLPEAVGTTTINGIEVGRGRGGDVLGHPLNALAWLATSLAARGKHLRAGEVVLTGSVVETKWLARGDRAVIAIDGLGEASLTVT